MEHWKRLHIKGKQTDYQISSFGKIRSLRSGHTLSPYNTVGRYLKLTIEGNKNLLLHRLVALHFVDGYKEGLLVDHKDRNRWNNRADNLKWVTPEESQSNRATKTVLCQTAITILRSLHKDNKTAYSAAKLLGINDTIVKRYYRKFENENKQSKLPLAI